MRQLLVRSGKVFLQDVPAPVAGPKNVLVRVERSCVSVGTEMAGVKMSGLPLYRRALKQPHHVKRVLQLMRDQGVARVYKQVKGKLDAGLPTGYSAAGTVIAVGSEVDGIAVGDRVACAGAGVANHAEVIDVPVNLCVPVPQQVSFDAAATVTLGAIAMQGVRRAQPTLGETVVVIGLGILGQITAQLLTANGCRVIGTDVDNKRIATALENGLDHGINPNDGNLVDSIIKLTDGFGADVAIITAASASSDILAQAFQSCRKKARVVIVGDVGLNMARSDIYTKELDVLISCSYGPGRYDPVYEEEGGDYPLAYVRWTENRNMGEYLRLLAAGRVRLDNMLQEPYPIDRAEEAYGRLAGEGEKPLLVLLQYPHREEAVRSVLQIAPPKPVDGRIKIAVVGAGSFAQGMHLPNLKKLGDKFDLRSVVSRTGLSARTAAERFGFSTASTDFQAILDDPQVDLVLIATRHDLHSEMTLAALKAGKHVFVEKPTSMTEEGLDAIEAFYADNPNGPLLMTGFNRRFAPAVTAAREAIKGRLSPMIVNYRMNAGYIPSDHWVHGPHGGGRNIGEACHIYDLFNALTGSQPVEVQARSIVPASGHWRRDDNFVATVRYADGSLCTLTYTSLGSKEFPKERFDIFVDGKVLVLDDYKRLEVTGAKGGWKGLTIEKGQLEELVALAEAFKPGGEWPISLADQLSATRVSFGVEKQLAE
ncbi:bi-domain-containing oxidoreductase [Bradyrhizobium barranii subsp. apii]|uniref:bi-domain-containing oxidoreductase n=1 Tax=Bradyrhizobium barranii TaxID=2992140 RepID=UPI001AA1363A|nr:bi-domain-containing oxidoreductase [Bradyrhizobium barranii]UPT93793.1 bi-domain-containing oxidoreductase [Bradyrhizobium barranii subsp. apii]